MVKNTTGGTGSKSLARKNQVSSRNEKLRLPEDALEQFAVVIKMLGNGMCAIITNENKSLIGHIRNSFRGKNKRHNMVSVGSIVLVGLYDWERDPKNCNIMVIYDQNQIEQLKAIPNIKIDNVLSQLYSTTNKNQLKSKEENNFDFVAEEDDRLVDIEPQRIPTSSIDEEIEIQDEINIDDI
jgi:initiation factor 1A